MGVLIVRADGRKRQCIVLMESLQGTHVRNEAHALCRIALPWRIIQPVGCLQEAEEVSRD
jgi:hypothetical protein